MVETVLLCGQRTKSNEPHLYHVNQIVYFCFRMLYVFQDLFLNEICLAWELFCHTSGFLLLALVGNSTAFQCLEIALQICVPVDGNWIQISDFSTQPGHWNAEALSC